MMTQNSFDVSPSCAEKQLDKKEIYNRVLKIDAHVKVLYLACLQIDHVKNGSGHQLGNP